MFREVAILLDKHNRTLYWHLPPDRSGGAIPDSQTLWDIIWENRNYISGIAHSHPGGGIPGPSQEDYTTFRGVEKGLWENLNWWIVSSDATILFRFTTPPNHPEPQHRIVQVVPEPWWANRLREVSRYETQIRSEVCHAGNSAT